MAPAVALTCAHTRPQHLHYRITNILFSCVHNGVRCKRNTVNSCLLFCPLLSCPDSLFFWLIHVPFSLLSLSGAAAAQFEGRQRSGREQSVDENSHSIFRGTKPSKVYSVCIACIEHSNDVSLGGQCCSPHGSAPAGVLRSPEGRARRGQISFRRSHRLGARCIFRIFTKNSYSEFYQFQHSGEQ